MRPTFVAIDIETSGRNPKYHKVLELGAIAWGPEVTRDFQCFVEWRDVNWCSETFKFHGTEGVNRLMLGHPRVAPTGVSYNFIKWLDLIVGPKVIVGKNFGGFDRQFLMAMGGFKEEDLDYRYLDVGSICFDPITDNCIPSTYGCLKVAGLDTLVKHTALEDCLALLKVVKWKYHLKGEVILPRNSVKEGQL